MKRASTILALVAILLLILGVAACGDGRSQAAGLEDDSPQGILTAAMAAAETMTSATGTFAVDVTFDADTAQMPAEAKAFVEEPMSISGTLAYGSEPQAADMTLSLSLAGEALNAGIKMLDDKGWMQLGGQWYEAPPELSDMMGGPKADAAAADQAAKMAQMKQALTAAGIDPLTWIKDLRLVGEEKVDGVDAYHLAGAPDLTKIIVDVMAMLQNPEAMKTLDPSGSLSGLMGGVPGGAASGSSEGLGAAGLGVDPSMLLQMQQQITAMFQSLTADVWIAKDDLMMLRFTAGAKIVPPAGEDSGGLSGITLDMDVTLQDHNQAVTVAAPAGAKPFSALEEAMEKDPASILGPLGGILGMTGGMGFGDATQ